MNKNKFNKFEELENIYNDKNRYYERFEKGRIGIGRILFFAILFIGVIGLTLAAGYYVFREPELKNFINKSDVTFEIKGNDQVRSGEESFYIIDYQNKSESDIDNGEISLNFPDGFIAGTTEPAPSDKKYNIWQVGRIKAGEGGQIKIKGIIIGSIGEEKELKAKLKYNPANTAAFFTRDASLGLFIKDVPLNLTIASESDFKANEKNEFEVKYINNSNSRLENLRLIISYPIGASFFIKDEEFKNKDNQYELDIKELQEKEEGKFTALIIIKSEDKNAEIKARIGYVNDGNFIAQKEDRKSFSILNKNLAAEFSINGAVERLSLNGGEKLTCALKLKNEGNQTVENIEPRVFIDDNNDLLDWDSLSFKDNGKMENKEIFWDEESLINLSKLEQGKDIELCFSINIRNNLTNLLEHNLLSWAEIKMKPSKSSTTEEIIKSNLVEIKFNTDLNLKVQARYFSEAGEPLCSGPLPPKVNERTAYKIFWQLSNSINEIKDILVKAKLPENASWEENTNVDSGQLYFDQQKREIRWTVPKLPADLKKPIEGIFEISVKPAEDDIGKNMILLEDTNLTGTDKITGTQINLNHGPITTNLENDAIGQGKGEVVSSTEID